MSGAPTEIFLNESGFAAESRCLNGHFPGNPIVPGAMILSFLAASLAETGRALAHVERMKFQRVLLPDVPFEVRLTHMAGRSRAEWRDQRGVFASARLVLHSEHG